MEITILSSKICENQDANNGDCIIIDNGEEMVLYDCGCEEYARYVIKYMDEKGYKQLKIILSHNDDDHFKGVMLLVEEGRVSEIITVLLLKYINILMNKVDDKRKSWESTRKQLLEKYDNIAQLSGCKLKDAFEVYEVIKGVKLAGPSKDYILSAAAKGLDTRESDSIDGETITNATSIHVVVEIQNKKILLTGDSTYESVMQENLNEYDIIQLPHHGKKDTGEAIMEETKNSVRLVYIVSDNTGTSNGGSDNLETKGYDVRNTKDIGNIIINNDFINKNMEIRGNLCEIYNNIR